MGLGEDGSGAVCGVGEGGGQLLARYGLHDEINRNEAVGGTKAREKKRKREEAGRLVLYRRAEGSMVPCMNMMNGMAFIQGLGGPELLIILVIILLLFGAKKLPELARGLGKSMKEFKQATQEVQDDFHEAMDSVDLEEKRKKASEEGHGKEGSAGEEEKKGEPKKSSEKVD